MVKTRVIPILTVKDLRLVKSIKFADHRNIGSYIAAVRVFNVRDVDEMVFLDIDGSQSGIKYWLLKEVTKECFMPLTIGGGIKNLEDIRAVLQTGADKVSINTSALANPDFIEKAAKTFGSQSIVVSIDAKKIQENYYEVFGNGGSFPTGKEVVAWAKEAEARGAGEILLASIDQDGMMAGYEIPLIKKVSAAVKIPVIAAGGAGIPDHCVAAVKSGGASAVAAASIFQYTQITPLNIKQRLAEFGVETRI